MLKNKRVILVMFTILTIIITLIPNVKATDLKTELQIVNQSSETKYLDNDQGYISKKIIDSNSDTGEVTIELKLSNTAKEIENVVDTEIFLVVDNSPSMDFVTSTGETRKEIVLNSASSLVESIFGISSNIKIGLIDFHGYGLFSGGASIYNATVRQKLTDDKTTILNAISKEMEINTENGTNIEAGLRKAMKNFSTTTNKKVVILLTDGLPNSDINGNCENDVASEKGISIQDSTKQAILDLKSNGIYTITMLTGMSESDGNTDKRGNVYNDTNTIEEELTAAERVFGTSENPTADKYYLVKSADINRIINNDILRNVSSVIRNPINNVKIVDYFPEDITENFEFSYVGEPNIGTVSKEIDEETKTISWNMEILKGNEVATLKYKLKLKDMKNEELLEKVIATNEKVVLTYTDSESSKKEVILESSPKIKLTKIEEKNQQEPEEPKKPTNTTTTTTDKKDNTIASGKIPYTGGATFVIISLIGIVAVGIYVYKRNNDLKGI